MELEIKGLTPRQKVLCDIIWACGSKDQVDMFIQSLPALQQHEARTMVTMMSLAFFDTVDHVSEEVEILLDKIKNR